jgi:hypothetical protein
MDLAFAAAMARQSPSTGRMRRRCPSGRPTSRADDLRSLVAQSARSRRAPQVGRVSTAVRGTSAAAMPMTAGIADADTSTTQAGISGTLLVPVILTLIPFLVAGQAWVWWTFRHRVTGPSYL